MSIVLACKKDGVIYLASDTRDIFGEKKVSRLSPSTYKIVPLEGGLILSLAGERKTEDVIKAYSEIFTLNDEGKLTKEHIVKKIVPELIGALKEQEVYETPEDDLPYMKAQIMLVHEGELFEICSNFMVIKYESFLAIGHSSHALGAILNMEEYETPNECLISALDITATYNQDVMRPYVLIDTSKKTFSIVR